MSKLLIILVFCALIVAGTPLATQAGPSPQVNTRERLKKLANEIGILEFTDIVRVCRPPHKVLTTAGESAFGPMSLWVYGQSEHRINLESLYPTDYELKLNAIFTPAFKASEIIPLLKDVDPSVRAIACCALYNKDEPASLPLIASLAQDDSKTKIKHLVHNYGQPRPADFKPATANAQVMFARDWKVSELVRMLFSIYLAPAGYDVLAFDSSHSKETALAFNKYWKVHHDLKNCAGYFAARSRRLRELSPAAGSECEKRVSSYAAALRQQIDALPSPERELTILFCFDNSAPSSCSVFKSADALAAAKKLGPDNVMKFLQEKSISGDPDLNPKTGSPNIRQVWMFLTAHASELLKKDQVDSLLACEKLDLVKKKANKYYPVSAAYACASAELDPARSRKILHEAIERFSSDPRENDSNLRELSLKLWNKVKSGQPEQMSLNGLAAGKNEFKFQVEQYYKFGTIEQYTHIAFSLGEDTNAESHRLLSAIRNDSRYQTLPQNAKGTLAAALSSKAAR